MCGFKEIVVFNGRSPGKKAKLTLTVDSVLLKLAKEHKINISATLERLLETLDSDDWKVD